MANKQPKANIDNIEQPENNYVAPKKEEYVDPMVKANRDLAKATEARKRLLKYYKEEPKVTTYVSPMYKPYFGNVMTVTISGISIRFPIDGSKHDIPATFADEIERRRRNVDAIINKQKRMASISTNVESNPGELELF